jgi:uncharacterized protein YraI
MKTVAQRKVLAAKLTLLLLVVPGALALSPSPAGAAISCTSTHPDKDSGSGQVYRTNGAGLNLHSGPYTGCERTGYVPDGGWVTFHCFLHGSHVGNIDTWTYVEYQAAHGSHVEGFVPDYYLRNDAGSNFHC